MDFSIYVKTFLFFGLLLVVHVSASPCPFHLASSFEWRLHWTWQRKEVKRSPWPTCANVLIRRSVIKKLKWKSIHRKHFQARKQVWIRLDLKAQFVFFVASTSTSTTNEIANFNGALSHIDYFSMPSYAVCCFLTVAVLCSGFNVSGNRRYLQHFPSCLWNDTSYTAFCALRVITSVR